MILQIGIYLTLQVFQLRKTKGAIRIYLMFEFFFIICINTSRLLYVIEYRKSWNRFMGLEIDEGLVGQIFTSGFLLDVKMIILSLRNSFIILITYNAHYIISKPFEFRKFIQKNNVWKRNAFMLACLIIFHSFHLARDVYYALLRFGLVDGQHVVIMMNEKNWFVYVAESLSMAYYVIIITFGTRNCLFMKKTINELSDNLINVNRNCSALYILSVILVVLATCTKVVETGIFIVHQVWQNDRFLLWSFTAKIFFDMVSGIVVTIVLFICFPKLRPNLTNNESANDDN